MTPRPAAFIYLWKKLTERRTNYLQILMYNDDIHIFKPKDKSKLSLSLKVKPTLRASRERYHFHIPLQIIKA